MTAHRTSSRALRFAAATAMSAVALTGCAGGAHLSKASHTDHPGAKAARQADRAVANAESAVQRSPNNATLRSELGLAYLQAGRFASAATAFDDATKLGDNSARTALSLALAKVGNGQGREAAAILHDWRDSIPAADLGLALALAGDTGRGVGILSEALRAGQNTPKLRQNLAYAYALDGRWAEARTMMLMDVPANEIDQRINEWAMQAQPEDYQRRVASLLGAPVRSDPGLPQNLALNTAPEVQQLAAEATVQPPAPVAAAELPAAQDSMPYASVAVADAPAPAEPVSAPASGPVVQNTFASAFTAEPAPAPRTATPKVKRTVRVALPASKPVVTHNGSHMVQVGSFSSEQGARRGWGILTSRSPRLREYRMVITPAVVNGRNYWRLAAAGLDASSAKGLCSRFHQRGDGCFAYSADRVLTGAVMAKAPAPSGRSFARR